MCAGKIKSRSGSGVEKTYEPGDSVYVFDFSAGDDPEKATLRVLPQDGVVTAVKEVISSGTSPIVLLATGGKQADRLRTFDPLREKRLDECEAAGVVQKFED